ncbi:TPA: Rha family transcriptional regulator [Clostridioides difficile]|uniref:Rha family transcriptional regulator n=2 Tax=Clostridioides difficile TaxID=1496 RepID=UPI0002F1DEB6|nr:Rha family transcriptional regulator [Clostridioides difficile]EGT2231043.1 Rha family transcriptional regulator [Clostridioides difficile]EGT3734505.1 Rha family transcriptional regulator [Clostridioides difficile]EGT4166000.1 Rha family transcriptional regulator [Clostridioides difficile]EGT4520553.1 Rha family transcriptional regulator [Clostridioides difficile]EGT4836790.1 Rha family transcriptional regulator [Clostridioides difficile]
MNNLQLNNKNTITTLEIADMLEINHWEVLRKLEGTEKTKGIIDILNDNNFVVVDYFIKSAYLDLKNENRKCYNVTKLGCDFLANKFTGEKGIIFTARYVKRFNKMEQELKEQQPKLPTTYKEALQQLLIEVEEKEQLQLENQAMKPKADYFDALVERNLLTNIRDTAKELGVKEKVFVSWLIEKKYCYRDSKDKLQPYANRMQYFEKKEFTNEYGYSGVQTLINPRGREAIRLLLIKDGLIKEKEKGCQITLLG